MEQVTRTRWGWASLGGVLGAAIGFVLGNWLSLAAMIENVTGSKSIHSLYNRMITCQNRAFCTDGLAFEVRLRPKDTTDADFAATIATVAIAPGTTCEAVSYLTWPLTWVNGYRAFDSYVVQNSAEIGKKVPNNQGSVEWPAMGLEVLFHRTDRGFLTFRCVD